MKAIDLKEKSRWPEALRIRHMLAPHARRFMPGIANTAPARTMHRQHVHHGGAWMCEESASRLDAAVKIAGINVAVSNVTRGACGETGRYRFLSKGC